ncbi:MAG: DUF2442 domain-containing protein [Rhodocyclaceae bacterium]|nr:DUF2442 domain-containing protein [Rhodocyclaceae bacterium]MDP1957719.1 DUF2442 domain-containing protein [Rhodocyclaceae bacterium]
MIFSQTEIAIPHAIGVHVSEDALSVDLEDGRTLTAPLGWYPRLVRATPEERGHWRLIGPGTGIHWEDVDEDISVEGLLRGKPSGESQRSFERWLSKHRAENVA